jgi:hypothetical protein
MNDMLIVLKALAPDTATVTAMADDCLHVTDRWPGRAERYTLQFSRRPDGAWDVFAMAEDDPFGASSRRLAPFRPCDVLRLKRFFADPLRWFLKGVKA